MTLIVEDGSVVAGAESLCTVAFASAYHTARGNVAWAALASDTIREQALRRATDYMGQVFGFRCQGLLVAEDQPLFLPRSGMVVNGYQVASDIVPDIWQRACAELALKASAESLLADQDQAIVREKIGPIETEYDRYSQQSKRYPAVERMLAPYLTSYSGASVRLERA